MPIADTLQGAADRVDSGINITRGCYYCGTRCRVGASYSKRGAHGAGIGDAVIQLRVERTGRLTRHLGQADRCAICAGDRGARADHTEQATKRIARSSCGTNISRIAGNEPCRLERLPESQRLEVVDKLIAET